jgi:uncharacterized protein (DUF2141 family)
MSTEMANGKLTVTVHNLRNNKGHVRLALFTSPEGFPGNLAHASVVLEGRIDNGVGRIEVPTLAHGTYAGVAWHDENDNAHLDLNYKHLPEEGFGFTNHPDHLRHLTWQEASFQHSNATTQDIRLIYR